MGSSLRTGRPRGSTAMRSLSWLSGISIPKKSSSIYNFLIHGGLMGFLSRLFSRSEIPSVQQIVEKLLPMRIMDRSSWDTIRQWLGSVLVDMDHNKANRIWLEIQEKCRQASSLFFYRVAKENGLTQEAAIDFAEKWTLLTNFWFAEVDRPVNKTPHLLRLDREPESEIDLFVAEIGRQDRKMIRHLAEMRQNDPEAGRYLTTLRRMQIEATPIPTWQQTILFSGRMKPQSSCSALTNPVWQFSLWTI
jgi:hypothetical protein